MGKYLVGKVGDLLLVGLDEGFDIVLMKRWDFDFEYLELLHVMGLYWGKFMFELLVLGL